MDFKAGDLDTLRKNWTPIFYEMGEIIRKFNSYMEKWFSINFPSSTRSPEVRRVRTMYRRKKKGRW